MKSIRTGIMLLVIGVAFGVALLLTADSTYRDYYQQLDSNTLLIQTNTEELALELSGFMQWQKGYLEGHVQSLLHTKDYTQPFIATFTANMPEGNPYLIYSYFNTPTDEGHFTSSDGWIPPEDYSWQNRYWMAEVSDTDEVFVDFPSYDTVTQKLVTVIRQRVYDGELQGMLNMAIELEELKKLVEDYEAPSGGYAFIVNEDGRLVYHPNIDIFTGSEQGEETRITDLIIDFDWNQRRLDIEGNRFQSSAIEGTRWTVWSAIPLEWYTRDTASLLMEHGVVFAIALVLTIFSAFMMSAWLTGPVIALSDVAHNIGDGDYITRVSDKLLDVPNEIGELAKTFELMRQRIATRSAELIVAKNEAVEAKDELQHSYQELQALHEEMVATEEALQVNYDQLNISNEKLEYIAYHHEGTGFFNERKLLEELKKIIDDTNNGQCFYYITTKELPDYRMSLKEDTIQEIHGLFGRILQNSNPLCPNGPVYHLATGVYGLLCSIEDLEVINGWLKNLRKDLSELRIGEDQLRVSLTPVIGIVGQEILDSLQDPKQVIDFGRTTAVKAMEQSLNEAMVYSRGMYKESLRLQQLETALHEAIDAEDFSVVYQPKYDHEGRICGAEALARWYSQEFGQVSPAVFIPMAERLGLVGKIDMVVIKQTIAFQQLLRSGMSKEITITCNLSLQDLMDDSYLGKVTSAIERSLLKPSAIAFEITETAFASEFDTAKENILAYCKAGYDFHLDDYGTGYSSMNYLVEFPVSTIKLDGSFAKKIADNDKSAKVVRSAVILVEALGLDLVAEGVETEAQFRKLKEMGCKYFQGYYFARPMSATEFQALIETEK